MFEALEEELLLWSNAGDIAQLWWRDDDTTRASAQLDELLEISTRYAAPLSLATIPDGVENSLAQSVADHKQLTVLQHGFNHQNFAPADVRKMELGWHRPAEEIMAQLKTGIENLQSSFGGQFLPIMVPPWNRIDERVIARLKGIGFCGLSTLGPRKTSGMCAELIVVNVHVDIINWQQGRCFAGYEVCEAQIVAHLSAKRTGRVDAHEPTGIMSHHLVHDDGCQQFLASLFDFLGEHPAVALLDAKTVFADPLFDVPAGGA